MGYHHQVVELDAGSQAGVSDRRSVDCGVGTDVDLRGDHHPAGLRNGFGNAARHGQEAKTVGPYHSARLQGHIIADHDAFANHRTRVSGEAVPDSHAWVNRNLRVYAGVPTYNRVLTNNRAWADVGAFPKGRRRRNHSAWVYARPRQRPLVKQLKCGDETTIRVLGSEKTETLDPFIHTDNRCRRSSTGQHAAVPRAGYEGERSRRRFIDGREPGYFYLTVAVELDFEATGEFRQAHDARLAHAYAHNNTPAARIAFRRLLRKYRWLRLPLPLDGRRSRDFKMIDIDFGKAGGLVPVVVQDAADGTVLMLAYMNEEAWNMTLGTGVATYWSRSRNQIWIKGESSGHKQEVREVNVDCDNDTVLLKVEQRGGAACHEGYRSCFFRRVIGNALEVVGERVFDPGEVYEK